MEDNKRTASNNGRQCAFFRYLLVGHEKAPSVFFAFAPWDGNPRRCSVSGASGGSGLFLGWHDIACCAGRIELSSGAAILPAGEGCEPAAVLLQKPGKQCYPGGKCCWHRRTAFRKMTQGDGVSESF